MHMTVDFFLLPNTPEYAVGNQYSADPVDPLDLAVDPVNPGFPVKPVQDDGYSSTSHRFATHTSRACSTTTHGS